MRPAKWKFGRDFLPISSPAADTGNTPRSCPQDGKKSLCRVYKYSKYCEYRCGAPQAVRRKPLRKKEQTLDKKEIDHFEYHL